MRTTSSLPDNAFSSSRGLRGNRCRTRRRCGATAVHEHRSEHNAVCQTNGSAQIVTSPPINNNWYGGWPWGGGVVIGLGGWGFGW